MELYLYGNDIGYDGVTLLNKALGCGNCPKLSILNVSGDPDECNELYNHLSCPQCPVLDPKISRSSEVDNMFSKMDVKSSTLLDFSVKSFSLQAIHIFFANAPPLVSVVELNLSGIIFKI